MGNETFGRLDKNLGVALGMVQIGYWICTRRPGSIDSSTCKSLLTKGNKSPSRFDFGLNKTTESIAPSQILLIFDSLIKRYKNLEGCIFC